MPDPTRDFAATTFVVDNHQTLLLWHRKLQAWLPPGGHIEANELPEEAAVREVREESGLIVRVIGLEGVYHVRADPRGLGVMILYRAVAAGGQLRAGDDASELGFFGPDELPPDLAFSSTRRALFRWRRRLEQS